MDFTTLCKDRYSVRAYSDKPIEEEKLNKILQTALSAPTAKNNRPVRFIVCKSQEALAKAASCSPCTFNAPAVIIVCTDTDVCWNATDGSRTSADIDATLVGSQLMLSATENGLGTCFVLLFDPQKTKEVFELPNNIKPIFYMPIGYKTETAEPNPRHFQRDNLKDVTKIL